MRKFTSKPDSKGISGLCEAEENGIIGNSIYNLEVENAMLNMNWLLQAATDTATAVADTAATTAADAADATAQVAGWEQTIPSLLMIVAMVAVFYFLLIRPQRKKDKAVKDMLAALKVGDRVCTIGGIYGTVTALKDDTVTLAVGGPKTPMVMARWAIRSVEDAPLENDAEPQV